MIEGRSRSELFGEVLQLLESAVKTAAENGDEDAAVRIRETLVPFVRKEYVFAEMAEEA